VSLDWNAIPQALPHALLLVTSTNTVAESFETRSALGCGVCMLIYIVLTTLPANKSSAATNWAAVAIIILYEVVFAFGWLGTCWVYGPEIAPLKYRHVAGSLGAAGEWFSTFVMVFGGGTGINAVGPKIFIWPLLCCFLAAAYVYFLCPESKSWSAVFALPCDTLLTVLDSDWKDP